MVLIFSEVLLSGPARKVAVESNNSKNNDVPLSHFELVKLMGLIAFHFLPSRVNHAHTIYQKKVYV